MYTVYLSAQVCGSGSQQVGAVQQSAFSVSASRLQQEPGACKTGVCCPRLLLLCSCSLQPLAPPTQPLPPLPSDTAPPDPCYSTIEKPHESPRPTPLAIYQSVEEVQEQASDSHSHSAQPSLSSPLSPASPREPDPNATYALVDMEKKRASRRQREAPTPSKESPPTNHVAPPTSPEAVDSWV